MLVKTILNRIQKYPGFVYALFSLVDVAGALHLDIQVEARRGARAFCSGCARRRPGYDHLPERRFAFVPLWGMPVFLVYSMRRVSCRRCGIIVEMVPWAEGKSHVTIAFGWFLANWAKRMSWRDVARTFRTSWENVFQSVEMAVEWGRAHVDLTGIEAIGIDEIHWSRKSKFLTLVYQVDKGRRRLLWIGQERRKATLLAFFQWFGATRSEQLRFVCSDMWKAYLTVVAKKAEQAIHVLDRFHIASHLSKAIDKVRATEVKDLRTRGGQPVLTKTRWLFLRRPENLTVAQELSLATVVRLNLRTVRAYLLKEDFQFFWEYLSPFWAGQFLDRWCTRAMRSQLAPMKRIARMLRVHRPLLLNWFRAKGEMSSAAVEGLNGKAKLIARTAFGFRTYRAQEVALYHRLGHLPQPAYAHRFL
jgi:transposase